MTPRWRDGGLFRISITGIFYHFHSFIEVPDGIGKKPGLQCLFPTVMSSYPNNYHAGPLDGMSGNDKNAVMIFGKGLRHRSVAS